VTVLIKTVFIVKHGQAVLAIERPESSSNSFPGIARNYSSAAAEDRLSDSTSLSEFPGGG